MAESLKVGLMLAGICSLIVTVGCCLFFTACKKNDKRLDDAEQDFVNGVG